MSKLLKITIEYEDKIMTIEGEEADKWDRYNTVLATLAYSHGMNPFDNDPVKWKIERREYMKKKQGEKKMKRCPGCDGTGHWWTECCNGAGGCDCHGAPVNMGICNVCQGKGRVDDNISEYDLKANCRQIQGLCFVGSGPSSGYWANK